MNDSGKLRGSEATNFRGSLFYYKKRRSSFCCLDCWQEAGFKVESLVSLSIFQVLILLPSRPNHGFSRSKATQPYTQCCEEVVVWCVCDLHFICFLGGCNMSVHAAISAPAKSAVYCVAGPVSCEKCCLEAASQSLTMAGSHVRKYSIATKNAFIPSV